MIDARVLAMVLGCVLLAGCAPFALYRSDPATCMAGDAASLDVKCERNAVQVLQPAAAGKPGYVLGFIEFDDQGQLWSREQMHAVMASVATQTDAGTADYLMVVFAHGWKHNAGAKDTNVANFREALLQLSETEIALSRKVGRPARKIIGVYLGWRGGSITVPYVENLTFWDRKNAAHKVGHGQVTEVLERLDILRQQRIARNPDSRSRLIIVGHSFGGAVVFSALEQILEARFAESAEHPQEVAPVTGFGNLVVLINPAFEAQLYAPLSDLSTEQSTYAKSQLPVLAVLTSEADWATGVAFPAGRWFSTWFEKQRRVVRKNPVTSSTETVDQHRADVASVGHFEPYRTHTLRPVTTPASVPIAAQSGSQKATAVADSSQKWEDDSTGGEIDFPGSVLTRGTNSAARDPYLIIGVDKALIADHNDIWRPEIRAFITHLILISSQSSNLAERQEHRDAARQ